MHHFVVPRFSLLHTMNFSLKSFSNHDCINCLLPQTFFSRDLQQNPNCSMAFSVLPHGPLYSARVTGSPCSSLFPPPLFLYQSKALCAVGPVSLGLERSPHCCAHGFSFFCSSLGSKPPFQKDNF